MFRDGQAGLIIGPVDPVIPVGVRPVGLVFGLALVPLIATLIGWRISRQLKKIDEASRALGAGNLGARVKNPTGPSSELAASFNDMAERIERLIRERDELIQAVSHELGSPLARLRFQLELLADSRGEGQSSADAARLEAMAHQVDELDQLVEDLLRWVQSDQDAVRCEEFDAAGPLANLAELAQLDAPETKSIAVELDAPTSVMLRADPRSYQRAVDNLLRNAVRYASTRVLLRLRLEDSSVVVSVEDDGPGIPESERQRVVEPFIRVGPDRDRRTGGAGLGLAIVTRIMRAHGGKLVIDDSPLGGARLALYFPNVPSDTQPVADDRVTPTRSRSRHPGVAAHADQSPRR
ncbi:MAG: ATP-binding protein [Kofleriaceae bacterium]|nr:ATP-binding protein [Kofleriaceae bacterium]